MQHRDPSTSLALVGLALALSLALPLGAGCSCSSPPVRGRVDGGGGDVGNGFDAGPIDANIPDTPLIIPDAYIVPDPDAFFAIDPPAMTCYPDGGMGPWPDPPGGTPECPDDRRREGCRCNTVGETGACWPGPRRNRLRGQCRDGTTTCVAHDEFGGVWGPCVGAVLPDPTATRGPAACECFSMGRWAIDNLSPCFVDYGASGVYAVSTFIDAAGHAQCPTHIVAPPPPAPEPGTNWSTDSLTVDCAGSFHLCYTLRAGNAMAPSDTDCVVAETCVDTWYPTAGATQTLPPLPSWTSSNPTCAASFRDHGGYGEMSVTGLSIECDNIGDAGGARYVFNRVNYCPVSCNTDPTGPGCAGCMMGGSGSF